MQIHFTHHFTSVGERHILEEIEIRQVKMKMMMSMNSLVTPLLVSCLLLLPSTIDAFQFANERGSPMASKGITSHERDESTSVTKFPSIGTNLPPVIQQIANERAEFQINLGRAMDTLRKDMPYILSQTPGTLSVGVLSNQK